MKKNIGIIKVVKLDGELLFKGTKGKNSDVFFDSIYAGTISDREPITIYRDGTVLDKGEFEEKCNDSYTFFSGLKIIFRGRKDISWLTPSLLKENDEIHLRKEAYDWLLVTKKNAFQAGLIFEAVRKANPGKKKEKVEELCWKELGKRNIGKKFIHIFYPKIKILREKPKR